METDFKNVLNSIRTGLLELKKDVLVEPEMDEEKKLFMSLDDYEAFVIESTLSVLQGELLLDEYPKLKNLDSCLETVPDSESQTIIELKKRKNSLDKLYELLITAVKENVIQKTFEHVTPRTKFTGVYNANGQLEAESLKLFLNSLGFPVRIYQESAGVVYGLTVGPLGLAEIMVPEEDTLQAKEVLIAMENGLFIQEDEEYIDFDGDLEDY